MGTPPHQGGTQGSSAYCHFNQVIAVLHHFAYPGIPKMLEPLERQFHMRGLADDDLQGRIKEVVDACEVCAQSKARRGPHPDSCEPFPVPSYPFASLAMDFVSLPEVKHPETGVKVDYAMVVVCRLTGYILAIPCKQEGLMSHKAAALFLHYCAFFYRVPQENTLRQPVHHLL